MDSISLYISVIGAIWLCHENILFWSSLQQSSSCLGVSFLPDSVRQLLKFLLPGNTLWRLFTAVQSAVNNSVPLYKLLSVSITLINEPAVATRPQPNASWIPSPESAEMPVSWNIHPSVPLLRNKCCHKLLKEAIKNVLSGLKCNLLFTKVIKRKEELNITEYIKL